MCSGVLAFISELKLFWTNEKGRIKMTVMSSSRHIRTGEPFRYRETLTVKMNGNSNRTKIINLKLNKSK